MSRAPGSGPRRALGLSHQREGDGAPRVVAKGQGALAERILAVAREYGVPVREDPDLAELLTLCDVGDEIPVEVFGVVARLLACLYRLNGGAGSGRAPRSPTGTSR